MTPFDTHTADPTGPTLTEVLRTADQSVKDARTALHRAILSASRAGMTYRQIAAVVGLSHTRVAQIVKAQDGGEEA